MLTRRALICCTLMCTLAATLIFSTPAQAAPTGEPNAVAEGLAATLEITKLDADLANALPTELSPIDIENVQPYASTEVDTEAELAATSLPMTVEEMALAEVAAVVAELTTTTAAEMKAREQTIGVEEEAAQEQIRSRAEEVKRQTIEREIASIVDSLEGATVDGVNRVAATTFRSVFADVIGTTQTPQTISQTTTVADPATTESPAILNELVRAAAAANEILAAALNAASMAVSNVTATTTAGVTSETAITIKPEAEEVDGGLVVAMSDSEAMTEASVTEQPHKIEATNIAVTAANSATAVAAAPTPSDETTHSAKTPNANEVSSDNLLLQSESEVLSVAAVKSASGEATDVQETPLESTTTAISATESITERVTESVTESATESVTEVPDVEKEIQTTAVPVPAADLAPFMEYMHTNTADNGEIKQMLLTVNLEAAESNKIITTNDAAETSETTMASIEDASQEERETTTHPLANSAATAIENDLEPNILMQEATQIPRNILLKSRTAGASPIEDILDESNKEVSEFEIAKVEEVKRKILSQEMIEEMRIENEISAKTITTTTETSVVLEGLSQPTTEELKPEILGQENSLETKVENEITTTTTATSTLFDDLSQATTEPLETLIAVESEARAPNTFVLAAEKEAEAVKEANAATTAAITEAITASEIVNGQGPELSAAEPITTTAKIASLLPIAEEFIAESTTKPEVALTTAAPEVDTTTTDLSSVNSVPEFTKTKYDAVKADPEPEPERIIETTTALIPDGEVIPPITTTTETAPAGKDISTREVAEVPELSTQISVGAIINVETTTLPLTETVENARARHELPILNTLEPVTETTIIHSEERAPETAVTVTEAASSSTQVPLAPFTTTPIVAEQLSNSEVTAPTEQLSNTETTTTIGDLIELSAARSTESVAVQKSSPESNATPAADIITTTLSSSTATTTTLASTEPPATHALEGDSIILDKTATTTGALAETSTTEATEVSVITTTTTKTETETFTPTEHQAETTTDAVAVDVALQEQPLYTRAQKVTTENESTTNAKLETVTETTELRTATAEVTATFETKVAAADTDTEAASTTPASMSAITKTTSATTITTSSTPEPENTTTTTTTTLSPMSLIVAEHEARSLERTPPRVSRIVSEDGVEVLSGYSIVHRMHAAALTALEAEGA